MNQKAIDQAVTEAKRFLNRVALMEKVVKSQKTDDYSWLNPKETGAVRRASMDLTRALADLRQGR